MEFLSYWQRFLLFLFLASCYVADPHQLLLVGYGVIEAVLANRPRVACPRDGVVHRYVCCVDAVVVIDACVGGASSRI